MNANRSLFWSAWTLANGLAELVCLEATYAALVFNVDHFKPTNNSDLQVYTVIAVTGAIIEATTVGLAQAWLMRMVFPELKRLSLWAATLLGTLLAYALGWWPLNRVLDWLENPPHTLAYYHEPSTFEVLLLVIGAGAAIGASLSFFQWLVLRGKVRQAWKWIEGNALAWAIGFPLILGGVALVSGLSSTWQVRLAMAEVILVIGLLVGAINGWYLARLAGEPMPPHLIRSIQDKLNAVWENLE